MLRRINPEAPRGYRWRRVHLQCGGRAGRMSGRDPNAGRWADGPWSGLAHADGKFGRRAVPTAIPSALRL